MRLQKIGIALAALSIVVSVVLWSIPAYNFEEGVPELTIHTIIKENQIPVIQDTFPITGETVTAFTIFNVEYPALDPAKTYTVEFNIDISSDADGTASTTFTGEVVYTTESFVLTDSAGIEPVIQNVPVLAGQSTTIHTGVYSQFQGGALTPTVVSKMVFDFSIMITGILADGSYAVGITSGTITMSEGATGLINITVDNITTSLEGS